jgi:anti-sigma B factor antagonist
MPLARNTGADCALKKMSSTLAGPLMDKTCTFESRVIDGDILAIILRGDLDSASTPEFNQRVQEHLDQGHTRIIIDCRHLGFLSSLGIGALVTLQTRLRRKGGMVKLAALQGTAAEVIRTVRLDKILDIYGDLEFARESFHKDQNAPKA